MNTSAGTSRPIDPPGSPRRTPLHPASHHRATRTKRVAAAHTAVTPGRPPRRAPHRRRRAAPPGSVSPGRTPPDGPRTPGGAGSEPGRSGRWAAGPRRGTVHPCARAVPRRAGPPGSGRRGPARSGDDAVPAAADRDAGTDVSTPSDT
ncbi:hypothetical protein D9753_01730 [Streptomyces dangxiongensis]|uniref:Uncharacterized protein n=1 Tax=Streptomyces dangxiongensis TaxID=1442032 RepID=A0A3G2J6Q3_9ACTN|nr:hypothetical protein D9753_01730 [Streptomyces dangxiongensis]